MMHRGSTQYLLAHRERMRLKIFDANPDGNDPPISAQQQPSLYDIQSLLGPYVQYYALHLNYPVSYAVHDVKVHGTTRLAATNRITSVIAHSYRYSNNTRGCVFIRQSYLDIFALLETACTLPPDCKRCAQRTRPCEQNAATDCYRPEAYTLFLSLHQ